MRQHDSEMHDFLSLLNTHISTSLIIDSEK